MYLLTKLLFSCSVMSYSLWPHGLQHTMLPRPLPSPGARSLISRVSDAIQWSHLFFSCLQSFPASGSFLISQLSALGGQNIGASASASVFPMNTQDWSSGWTGWISLLSKGVSRVFSNTNVWKHQLYRG